ncbi:uncharacterized protein LOC108679208 [Hyalella azteca]|uniref:Uncharacterized protein LOC108679208 n=1 Tax=Hyalella azteca TaxID=294128 RepID=A0A8B7PC90_HYAAZ|nr:uncharacterized protein LOC108679208 [Hyalella azteca]
MSLKPFPMLDSSKKVDPFGPAAEEKSTNILKKCTSMDSAKSLLIAGDSAKRLPLPSASPCSTFDAIGSGKRSPHVAVKRGALFGGLPSRTVGRGFSSQNNRSESLPTTSTSAEDKLALDQAKGKLEVHRATAGASDEMNGFDPLADVQGPSLEMVEAVHNVDESPYANMSQSSNLARMKLSDKKATGLYVRNVPLDMKQESLTNIFRQHGMVLSVFIKNNASTNHPTTYAIVKVPSMKEAMTMLQKLNGTPPFKFKVELALTEEEKNSRKMTQYSLMTANTQVAAEVTARDACRQEYLKTIPKPEPSITPAGGVGRGKKLAEVVSGGSVKPLNSVSNRQDVSEASMCLETPSSQNFTDIEASEANAQREICVDEDDASKTDTVSPEKTSKQEHRTATQAAASMPPSPVDADDSLICRGRASLSVIAGAGLSVERSGKHATKTCSTPDESYHGSRGHTPWRRRTRISPSNHCIRCGSSATMRCSICKGSYCSTSCQAQDWRLHMRECIPPPPLECIEDDDSVLNLGCYSPQVYGYSGLYQSPSPQLVAYAMQGNTVNLRPQLKESSLNSLQEVEHTNAVKSSPSKDVQAHVNRDVTIDLPLPTSNAEKELAVRTEGIQKAKLSGIKQAAEAHATKTDAFRAGVDKFSLKNVLKPADQNRNTSTQAMKISPHDPQSSLTTVGSLSAASVDDLPSKCVGNDLNEVTGLSILQEETEEEKISVDELDEQSVEVNDEEMASEIDKIAEYPGSVLDSLVVDQVYTGMVTFLKDDVFSLMMLDDNEETFHKFSTMLNSLPSQTGFLPEFGRLVASKTSCEDAWCRSFICSVDASQKCYKVCHVDFGYLDVVRTVKPIPVADFVTMPATGILGKMDQHDHATRVSVGDLIQFVVISKAEESTTVKILDKDGKLAYHCQFFSWWHVINLLELEESGSTRAPDDLDANATVLPVNQASSATSEGADQEVARVTSHSNANISQNLSPSTSSLDSSKTTNFTLSDLRCLSLDIGTEYTVLPVWCEEHFLFVQLVAEELLSLFGNLMDWMNGECELVSAPEKVRAGELLCAYVPDDKMWYRALVLEANLPASSVVSVYLVDFGSCSDVDVSCLRPSTRRILDLPIMCIKVALCHENAVASNQPERALDVRLHVSDIFKNLVESAVKLRMVILETKAGNSGHAGPAARFSHTWHLVKLFNEENGTPIVVASVQDDDEVEDSVDEKDGIFQDDIAIKVKQQRESDLGGSVEAASSVNEPADVGTPSARTPLTVVKHSEAANNGINEPAVKTSQISEAALVDVKSQDRSMLKEHSKTPEDCSTTSGVQSNEVKHLLAPGEVFFYENCPCVAMEPGENVELIILSALNTHTIMVVPKKEMHRLEEIEELSTSMNEYCNSLRAVYYEPLDGEVILAKFSQDGLWYRAACLTSVPQEGAAIVQFTDYGNIETVLFEAIVRMEERFVTPIPFLAVQCALEGTGDQPSSDVTAARLAELLPAFSPVTAARVLPQDPDSLVYVISIPAVLEALKSEGLLATP